MKEKARVDESHWRSHIKFYEVERCQIVSQKASYKEGKLTLLWAH